MLLCSLSKKHSSYAIIVVPGTPIAVDIAVEYQIKETLYLSITGGLEPPISGE
jgi:hypothetical protein